MSNNKFDELFKPHTPQEPKPGAQENIGIQAYDIIRTAIQQCLLSMGCDTREKSPEEIAILLDEHRIMLRDLDSGSKSSGIYIFHVITKLQATDVVDDILPAYFISDGYINKDLKVAVFVLDIDKNHGWELTGKETLKVVQ